MSVVGLFVDAENLVYGYLNRFRAKLDPGKLVEIASEYGTVKYYKCFGDFTNPGLKEYENRFKANTFDIISEPSVERNGKFKEFTDFNMLNHIYQTLIDDESVTT
ncbi:MAG: NYN domain-containing protein, partial [Firmicutes bacterium]|nr:NYN domain-containing protein [Bacillota bacterium]